MNKNNTQNLLKLQIFLIFSEALSMYIGKASEKKRNICNFNKFSVFLLFIYISTHTFKVANSYVYIYIYT